MRRLVVCLFLASVALLAMRSDPFPSVEWPGVAWPGATWPDSASVFGVIGGTGNELTLTTLYALEAPMQPGTFGNTYYFDASAAGARDIVGRSDANDCLSWANACETLDRAQVVCVSDTECIFDSGDTWTGTDFGFDGLANRDPDCDSDTNGICIYLHAEDPATNAIWDCAGSLPANADRPLEVENSDNIDGGWVVAAGIDITCDDTAAGDPAIQGQGGNSLVDLIHTATGGDNAKLMVINGDMVSTNASNFAQIASNHSDGGHIFLINVGGSSSGGSAIGHAGDPHYSTVISNRTIDQLNAPTGNHIAPILIAGDIPGNEEVVIGPHVTNTEGTSPWIHACIMVEGNNARCGDCDGVIARVTCDVPGAAGNTNWGMYIDMGAGDANLTLYQTTFGTGRAGLKIEDSASTGGGFLTLNMHGVIFDGMGLRSMWIDDGYHLPANATGTWDFVLVDDGELVNPYRNATIQCSDWDTTACFTAGTETWEEYIDGAYTITNPVVTVSQDQFTGGVGRDAFDCDTARECYQAWDQMYTIDMPNTGIPAFVLGVPVTALKLGGADQNLGGEQ